MRFALLLATVAASCGSTMGGFGSSLLSLSDTAILDRLKAAYHEKLRPLEKKGMYNELREPELSEAWFDARPMVLLIGQYSVGKTSFIRYLLGRDFPNQHVGPEPTTDRFVAVMHGDREKVTPGNALTSVPDTPFHSLRHFGAAYLDKLECASVPAPILRRVTLVDSPGVQAGEKQKGGRGYDYLEVIKWWAQHSDRILVLFDPNKLDISDEFRAVLEEIKPHQGKVRVVLNKADEIEPQRLFRVYGALMWSLGSIVKSPEVPRVYIGSFWDAPYSNLGMAKLMEAEEDDLVQELASLPEDNVMNKINEIARRARLVQVHVHLMGYMRDQVLSQWMYRKQKQEWVCSPEGMAHCYDAVRRKHGLSRGDFPEWTRLAAQLRTFDFNTFYKPSKKSKKLEALDELMERDIPQLIQQLHTVQKRQSAKGDAAKAFQPVRQHRQTQAALFAARGTGLGVDPPDAAGAGHGLQEAFASATSQLRKGLAGLGSTPPFGGAERGTKGLGGAAGLEADFPTAGLPAAGGAPAEAVPAEAVPAEAAPAEAVPAEAVPAEAAPAEAVPAGLEPSGLGLGEVRDGVSRGGVRDAERPGYGLGGGGAAAAAPPPLPPPPPPGGFGGRPAGPPPVSEPAASGAAWEEGSFGAIGGSMHQDVPAAPDAPAFGAAPASADAAGLPGAAPPPAAFGAPPPPAPPQAAPPASAGGFQPPASPPAPAQDLGQQPPPDNWPGGSEGSDSGSGFNQMD